MFQDIYFKTAQFDVTKESENPINPIFGESLLQWLYAELNGKYPMSESAPEDWGWYSELSFNGDEYLLGACAYFEVGDDPSAEIEWVFQIHKYRSWKEKLFGRTKMDANDPCLLFFKALLEQNTQFRQVRLG
ncbi:hypothetical protein [Motilimonas eburnea]|uniref:hypothetical protein n=1 Tax=Motilimonas eburnea TaxID=1737488 RepID=UPI001E4CE8FD|nr:hypothetical protein [Motilimonas eburnea]MCE2572470.1 hypothetical protein [Motilimonas eburnea]